MLSGVNAGQNLGDIIHCSGTAAGAREGALQGALGIAMSQGSTTSRAGHRLGQCAAASAAEVVDGIRAAQPGPAHVYNVNFPFCAPDEVSGVRVVPHAALFALAVAILSEPDNAGKFFVAIPETPMPLDPGSDFHLLTHGKAITVTPLACGRLTAAWPRRWTERSALPAVEALSNPSCGRCSCTKQPKRAVTAGLNPNHV